MAATFKARTSGRVKIALAASLAAASIMQSAYAGKSVQVEKVARGSAQFQSNGPLTVIRAANGTVINYRRFDIPRGDTVQFIQPGRTSRVLNRINSAEPSRIDGTLTANGIVYLVNPAGVMFGPNCVIDVGQIYAAAGNITDANFAGDVNRFTSSGTVSNAGTITAGGAHLIGKAVVNTGTIAAEGGLVTMSAGDGVLIGTREGHVLVKIDNTTTSGQSNGGVTNTGTVRAAAMSMAAGDLYSLAMGSSSSVTAKEIDIQGQGRGTVAVSGNLDASDKSAGATGGSVVITGEKVELAGANVDASGAAGGGTVLVGGDSHGQGAVRTAQQTSVDVASTISADALSSGDGGKVVVWSDGTTEFNGTIFARALGPGGRGGSAEVSGKEHLSMGGHAYLTGASNGDLLLDPGSVTIVSGSNTAPGGTLDTFNDGWVNDQLETGGNLTISTADSTNSAAEVLTVATGANINWTSGNSLTLHAGESAVINGPIANTGTGSVTIEAPSLTLAAPISVSGGTLGGVGITDVAVNSDGRIQNAVDLIQVGGTMTVGAGTYSENVAITKVITVAVPSGTAVADSWNTSTGISLSGNISSSTVGGILIDGALSLVGTTKLDTTNGGTFGGANLTLTSPVDGAAALELVAGAGNVDVQSDVGATTPLLGLTASGHNISLHNVKTTGAQPYSATGTLTLHSTYQTDGGAFSISGVTVLADTTTIDTELGDDGPAGAVDLSAATISAGAAGIDLLINSATAGAGQNGGAVTLGTMSNGGGFFVNDLTVDARGTAGGSSGTLTLTAPMTLADNGLDTADVSVDSDSIHQSAGTVTATTLALHTANGINGVAGSSGNALSTSASSIAVDNSGAAPVNIANNTSISATVTSLSTSGSLRLEQSGAGSLIIGGSVLGGAGLMEISSAGGIVLGADVRSAGATIQFDSPVLLSADVTVATTSAAATGGAIAFNGSSAAIDGAGHALTLDAGTAGAITVIGTVNGVSLLTIVRSNGATFAGAVGATAPGAVTITNTTAAATVAFEGDTHLTALTTTVNPYAVSFTGATNVVDASTTFLNTGGLTLGGNASSSTTFTNGLDTLSAGGLVRLAGTIVTTSDQMILGDITLTADTILRSNGFTLDVGAVSGENQALTFDGGDTGTVAADAVLAVSTLTIANSEFTNIDGPVQVANLALVKTTDTITFFDNVTVSSGMTTTEQVMNVEFHGASNTIAGSTTFLNTGSVVLGDEDTDSITFTGGLDTTQAGGTFTAGTVATVDSPMNLGAVSMVFDTTLKSGSGAINVDSLTDAGNLLTLTLQDNTSSSTGAVTFLGDVSVNTVVTFAQPYAVAFHGANNTIATSTQFLNTGGVSLGDQATDTTTFLAGVDTTTAGGTVSVGGTLVTDSAPITLGNITLSADTTLQSGGANIDVGAVTGQGNALALDADATGAVTVSSASGISTLSNINSLSTTFTGLVDANVVDLQNSASEIAFQGNVTIHTALTTEANDFNVSFTGSSNTVAGASSFLNSGVVTLGDAASDSITFTGGLDTTTGPLQTRIAGTVATTNTPMTLGDVVMTGDATLKSGSGAITVESLSVAGRTLTLQDNTSGSTGSVTFEGDVTLDGLTTFTQPYAVIFQGSSTTITSSTTFHDIGGLTLGDDDTDTTSFPGGLDAGGAVTANVAGTITTSNHAMILPAITMTADTFLNSGGGNIVIESINGGAHDFTLLAGIAAGTTTVNGQVTNLGSGSAAALTIESGVTGLVRFMSTLAANDGLSAAAGTNVRFDENVTLASGSTGTDLAGNVTLDGMTFSGNDGITFNTVTLSGSASTVTAADDSDVEFTGNITGDQALTVNTTGTTRFGGTVSAGSITTDAGGTTEINGGSISTTGAQSYGDAVSLGADTTFASTASGNITFTNTVNGNVVLKVTTNGTIKFNGAVGDDTPLASLTTDGTGQTEIGADVNTEVGQHYLNRVVLTADATLTDTGSTGITFDKEVDTASGLATGAGDLTLNVTGPTTFAGKVGSGTPTGTKSGLGSGVGASLVINSSGTTAFNDTVSTAGAIIQDGDAGKVTFSKNVTIAAGDGTATEFNADVQLGVSPGTAAPGTFTMTSATEVTFGDSDSDKLTIAAGTATIDVSAALLNTTTNRRKVTFNSTVDGVGASNSGFLAVNASTTAVNATFASTVTFNAPVGATTPLGGLSITASETDLNADSFTTKNGNISYLSNVKLLADATIHRQTTTATTSANGIFFNGTITGPFTLTVLADALSGDTRPAIISFAQSIGTSTAPLTQLRLNVNSVGVSSRSNVPQTATIVAAPRNADGSLKGAGKAIQPFTAPFNIFVEDKFAMGRNEKLTVLGPLSITATDSLGNVTLGDISTLRDMTITASNIQLLRRTPANALLFTGQLAADHGVDYVSGGRIRFSTQPVMEPPQNPDPAPAIFSYRSGLQGVSGFSQRQLLLPVQASQLLRKRDTASAGSFDRFFDLPAQGATPLTLAAALAGASQVIVPPPPTSEPGLAAAQREELMRMGIDARDLTTFETLEGLEGRNLYVQRPADREQQALMVAMGRLNSSLVADVLSDWRSLYVRDTIDSNGVVHRESLKPQINAALTSAVSAYSELHPNEHPIDPVSFRKFLSSSPQQKTALAYLDRLRLLLLKVQNLGLTDSELAQVKTVLFTDVKPAGMSNSEFEALVMGRRSGLRQGLPNAMSRDGDALPLAMK